MRPIVRMRQKGGEAGGARAFGHRLLDLEEEAHRRLHVAFGHEQDLVDHFGDDLGRHLARRLHSDAFRDRVTG
jgi:molybdenum-dependent DNA-binding transcriptional regulator ModE